MVSNVLINNLITETHEVYGHLGPKKIVRMLRDDFYIKHLSSKTR